MLGATFTFTNSRAEKKMLDHDLSLTHSGSESAPALHEVCRSVLNPASLSFVAANAPWDVVNSFEVRQQRLASLSLQVAGALLKRHLRATDTNSFDRPLLPLFRSHVSRMKSVMLLAACTFGRLGLGVLGTLWHGTPRHFQIDLSATILRNVGDLLTDSDTSVETRSESVPDADAIRLDALKKVYAEESRDSDVAADILRALAVSLPNELSRLIFLATLRDNNSGHYFHPDLARRFSERIADRAMLACHQRIYKQVVALSIEDLTDQFDWYVTTIPAPRERMIESWTKLKAYRATIPMDADPISAEIFFMKVEVAVAILEARLPHRIQ
jgi:hypothetical protein